MPKRILSTEQEKEVIELYVSGAALSEIKAAYSLTSDQIIYGALYRNGVSKDRRGKPGKMDKPMPSENVARALNVTLDGTDSVVKTETVERKGRYRFAVEFRVKHTVSADSMEAAIAQVKGYHGFEEVLVVRKIGE